ncbi:DUF1569 domain-containing protein [Ornithinibacillus sp. L9]|uniref:DUF1569 domain-containing protein n=1 Tax=Ornithinibacillus caprae TaxID=2678566 RepID=A0A6N8FLR5_9BACI|nr:DinB family protein [Ornithinibacillus caprae]MUK90303.1 DUF1569 domain-containing protein [Ornithinibacillus caprae]
MVNYFNDNLVQTRNNLLKEISSLKSDVFNNKPNKEKWSIAQVCHHLVLVEQATIIAVKWGLKENNRMNKDRKNIHLLLDRTIKRIAPKIVEPDEGPFEVQQIIDMFHDSREKLMDLLASIEDQSILMEISVKHPSFGELPLHQWVEVVYLHEQRHIEQIKEGKSI